MEIEFTSESFKVYKLQNYPLPVPHSALHYVLLHEGMEEVRRLLELGARPCLEEGEHSCFAYEKEEGEWYDPRSMRWFKSDDHSYKEAEEWEIMKLLLHYEPLGINILTWKIKKSLLMRFGYTAYSISFLVNLGANVNEKDLLNRTPVQHISEVYYYKPGIAAAIIELLKLGSDPIPEPKYNALEKILNIFETESLESIKLIEYLLSLPEDKKQLVVNCDSKYHPQCLVLNILVEYGLKREIVELFEAVMNSSFKNINLAYQEDGSISSSENLHQHYLLECPLKTITYCVMISVNYENVNLYEIIELLLKHGFKCDGFSPITAFIASLGTDTNARQCIAFVVSGSRVEIDEKYKQEEEKVSEIISVIRLLLNNGAHVQQRIMEFWDPLLKSLAKKYALPDALYIAVQNDKWIIVRLLLEHWGYPPLALLLFRLPYVQVYAILTTHCYALPQGTKLYRKVWKIILKSRNSKVIKHFKENHNSPVRLMELCRFKIRSILSQCASSSENTLQEMIISISPPGLKPFLLMKAPDNLLECQCDSVDIVCNENQVAMTESDDEVDDESEQEESDDALESSEISDTDSDDDLSEN